MAAAVGAGVALVPVPGTTAALSGVELLLIGAIAKIWGVALTPGYTAGLLSWMVARFGVAVGMHMIGDLIGVVPVLGTVAKSAMAAGTIKFIGSSMKHRFTEQFGENRRAHASADMAKANLDEAVMKLGANTGKLAEGAKQAFAGDGALLAATLNEIFGLGGPPEKAREEPKKPKKPKKPKADPSDWEWTKRIDYTVAPAGAEDFEWAWKLHLEFTEPNYLGPQGWDDDEQRLLVQQCLTAGQGTLVLVDEVPVGWMLLERDETTTSLALLCLADKYAVHVVQDLFTEGGQGGRKLVIHVQNRRDELRKKLRRMGVAWPDHA